MTHFRLRWQLIGGHVHVGVWSGTARDLTHGCNGRLIFRPEEWADLQRGLALGRHDLNVEIVPEDAEVPA